VLAGGKGRRGKKGEAEERDIYVDQMLENRLKILIRAVVEGIDRFGALDMNAT
jgi:hypothetical protein